ncbi:hypothetical protein [Bernardetia sp.]|uniref:hypothetical protein n=1 Tax=Bernardetia sp. TaxID=1937974 RepID=UPI0025BFD273|nr:hypothetical protein [Bernardetia sp.]
MKKIPLFYIVALFLFSTLFSGCDFKTTYETVVTGQKYSLDLPSYLRESKELHEEATLQYQNPLKEFYVVVIEDNKTEFNKIIEENGLQEMFSNDLKSYSDLIVAGLKENPEFGEANLVDKKIGTLDAKYFEFSLKLEELDVFYHYTLVEGKDTYYQILQWTLLDRKELHKAEMDKIAASFKEL